MTFLQVGAVLFLVSASAYLRLTLRSKTARYLPGFLLAATGFPNLRAESA